MKPIEAMCARSRECITGNADGRFHVARGATRGSRRLQGPGQTEALREGGGPPGARFVASLVLRVGQSTAGLELVPPHLARSAGVDATIRRCE